MSERRWIRQGSGILSGAERRPRHRTAGRRRLPEHREAASSSSSKPRGLPATWSAPAVRKDHLATVIVPTPRLSVTDRRHSRAQRRPARICSVARGAFPRSALAHRRVERDATEDFNAAWAAWVYRSPDCRPWLRGRPALNSVVGMERHHGCRDASVRDCQGPPWVERTNTLPLRRSLAGLIDGIDHLPAAPYPSDCERDGPRSAPVDASPAARTRPGNLHACRCSLFSTTSTVDAARRSSSPDSLARHRSASCRSATASSCQLRSVVCMRRTGLAATAST